MPSHPVAAPSAHFRKAVSASAAAVWLAMLLAGGFAWDRAVLRAGYSGETPLEMPAILVTRLGDWEVLVGIAFAASALLIARRRAREALFLMVVALVGRGLVTAQKMVFGRMRPAEEAHLVDVTTLSFPSGHSANTMITFLCLALLFAPADRRPAWLAVAVVASLAVGISRVLLGVHWPSDVIGGWSFGIFWVAMAWSFRPRRDQPGVSHG